MVKTIYAQLAKTINVDTNWPNRFMSNSPSRVMPYTLAAVPLFGFAMKGKLDWEQAALQALSTVITEAIRPGVTQALSWVDSQRLHNNAAMQKLTIAQVKKKYPSNVTKEIVRRLANKPNISAEHSKAFMKRLGIEDACSFEKELLKSLIPSINNTSRAKTSLNPIGDFFYDKISAAHILTSQLSDAALKQVGNTAGIRFFHDKINKRVRTERKIQKLPPPSIPQDPLYNDPVRWLISSFEGTAKTAGKMSIKYQNIAKSSSSLTGTMLRNEFENLYLHAAPYWNAQKKMALRAQNFNTIKDVKYGSFWKSTNTLKILGKLATPIDVAVRFNTVIYETEENRTRTLFRETTAFVAEGFADIAISSVIVSTTSGIGLLSVIPALVAANSYIEPKAQAFGDKAYDLYDWARNTLG